MAGLKKSAGVTTCPGGAALNTQFGSRCGSPHAYITRIGIADTGPVLLPALHPLRPRPTAIPTLRFAGTRNSVFPSRRLEARWRDWRWPYV